MLYKVNSPNINPVKFSGYTVGQELLENIHTWASDKIAKNMAVLEWKPTGYICLEFPPLSLEYGSSSTVKPTASSLAMCLAFSLLPKHS